MKTKKTSSKLTIKITEEEATKQIENVEITTKKMPISHKILAAVSVLESVILKVNECDPEGNEFSRFIAHILNVNAEKGISALKEMGFTDEDIREGTSKKLMEKLEELTKKGK